MSTDTLPRRGVLITAVIIRYYAGTVPLPDRDISHLLVMRNRLWE
jgi:hypothetical protein